MGRLKGRRLFEIYCRLFRLSAPRIGAADRFLRRFGGLTLVFARLAATLRIVVVPLAVSRGMSYGRFVAFDAMGAHAVGHGVRVAGTRRSACWRPRAAWGSSSAVVGALVTASAVVSVLARRRSRHGQPSRAD